MAASDGGEMSAYNEGGKEDSFRELCRRNSSLVVALVEPFGGKKRRNLFIVFLSY